MVHAIGLTKNGTTICCWSQVSLQTDATRDYLYRVAGQRYNALKLEASCALLDAMDASLDELL
ncbi:MAG: hypothetical protein U0930_05440 [Pirellulales bacterium]